MGSLGGKGLKKPIIQAFCKIMRFRKANNKIFFFENDDILTRRKCKLMKKLTITLIGSHKDYMGVKSQYAKTLLTLLACNLHVRPLFVSN